MGRTLLILISAILFAISVIAAVPRQITYQGILTDSNGNPLPDGDTTVTFTLYDTSGNEAGWTEDQSVTVSQGLFSALLGSVTPLDVAFDEPYELGVRIHGSSSELSPRVRLGSAAYALRAAVADSVAGYGKRVSTDTIDVKVVNASHQVNVGLSEGPQALNVIGSVAMTGSIREFSDTAASAIFSGTGNTTGPGFELYARDHPSLPGEAYLAYGGYDSLGHFQIRRYNGTSFANVALFDSVGRFGIGTTAPKTKVHIRSGDDPTLKIQSDGTDEVSGRISLRQSNETGVDICYDGRGGVDAMLVETYDANGPRDTAFAINVDGSVGVGTLNPERQFHIRVDGDLGSTADSYKALTRTEAVGQSNRFYVNDFLVRESTGADWKSASYVRGVSVDNSYLDPSTLRSWIKQDPYAASVSIGSGSTEYLRLGGGNLGLGSSQPSEKIHIQDTGSAGIRIDADTDNATETENPHLLLTQDGNLVALLATIQGGDDIDAVGGLDNYALFAAANLDGRGYGMQFATGGNTFEDHDIGGSTNGVLPTVALTINQNQNVGIGTPAPSKKLEVNGAVKATSFVVGSQTLAVPDYVFAEDYELMPLEELTSYVQERKHLPGVPNEAEVREKGLDLAQTNLAHLEKIEELTLYVIQAKKERDAIAGENAALRAEVAEMKNALLRLESKLNTQVD